MKNINMLAIFLLLVSSTVFAKYPAALPNYGLKEEIAAQKDRLIPSSDWFSAAVDGHIYSRSLSSADFYHGKGYILQARTEAIFSPYVSLNTRSIFYSGSISGGYAEPSDDYHLLGVNALFPKKIFGGELRGRAVDLDRRTIGNGLVIQDKEMAGVWLGWTWGEHSFDYILNGTGALLLNDDLYSYELTLWKGLFGGGVIEWATGIEEDNLAQQREYYYYIFSRKEFIKNVSYFFEAGSRHNANAGMLAFEYKKQDEKLSIKGKVQGRYYENFFGKDFIGNIQHSYVSYDQYDKEFADAINLFVTDDHAAMYSAIFDLTYRFEKDWGIEFDNEITLLDFKESKNREFYFYRLGVTYYATKDRTEAITFFRSNKVLTESFSRPPEMVAINNRELFKEKSFWGVEGSFRF